MKNAVLSRNSALLDLSPGGGRVERGHEMVVTDTLRAYMNIAARQAADPLPGTTAEGFDVILRASAPR